MLILLLDLQIQDLETNDTSAFLDEAKYWSRSRGKDE